MKSVGPDQPLHSTAAFRIGAVIKYPEITAAGPYRNIALGQFSSFTPERIFKAAPIHPEKDQFSWKDPDNFVALCETYKKQVHGHTLVWDRDLPGWLGNYAGLPDEIIESHVGTIVRRYRERISAWDVVNEAFDEKGELRRGNWWRCAGPGYLEKAFRSAAEADPEALLFYNDFNLEVNGVKRWAVIKALSRLRQKGVPAHGIGLQLHLHLDGFNEPALRETLRQLAGEGFKIHISELDVSVLPVSGNFPGKEELFLRQAEVYAAVVDAFMAVEEKYRYGITFWGIGDQDSWIVSELKKVDYPLLFDDAYRPKAAYNYVRNTLTGHRP